MKACGIELIDRGFRYKNKTAVVDQGMSLTYGDLLELSSVIAGILLNGQADLEERRISFLIPPGCLYVAVKWGIWRAGGITVPLCTFHPERELEYTISDSLSDTVVVHPHFYDKVSGIARKRDLRILTTEDLLKPGNNRDLPYVYEGRRAMILYTSGTTGKPKGVVTTHINIRAQVSSLVSAWEWTEEDYIINTLPLHHLHGILNLLLCPLWSGATCELFPGFDEKEVWDGFITRPLTLFMGVPTMYYKLIEYWENQSTDLKQKMSENCKKIRLMVSGSAALPVKTLEKWRGITGHTLLERYGMTEIGMVLSNPLHGKRIPGSVGRPLPGVDVELFDDKGVIIDKPVQPGEIMVRGKCVFLGYWNRPSETRRAFRDGWFKTGDIAVRDEEGNYRILGRNSVDIIKSGGFKISALEIEEVLRTNPEIKECCVVGIPDEQWGERVAALLVSCSGSDMTGEKLREWTKKRMAAYKVPTIYKFVDSLPRNVLGKVLKNRAKELF